MQRAKFEGIIAITGIACHLNPIFHGVILSSSSAGGKGLGPPTENQFSP